MSVKWSTLIKDETDQRILTIEKTIKNGMTQYKGKVYLKKNGTTLQGAVRYQVDEAVITTLRLMRNVSKN